MEYYSINKYLRDTFGEKVYKIALDANMTCPNRDGKIGYGGCIFCSGSGSGDFSEDRNKTITEQIESGKNKLSKKITKGKYIAYFQAFTNTYGDIEYLEKVYKEAIAHKDIVALSIATRPDCLPDDVVELIAKLNKIKPVWIELGLQTIHEESATYIRRGYKLECYDTAVDRLYKAGIDVITHVIIGLPGESKKDMLDTVDYVCKGHISGIKLQLLHVLEGTDLAVDYKAGKFHTLSLEEYVDIICSCVSIIPSSVVIHRLTGDGNKKDLIAPLWSGDKKIVLNALNKELNKR